jgi:uncharacterized protein (TIGR03083 family)
VLYRSHRHQQASGLVLACASGLLLVYVSRVLDAPDERPRIETEEPMTLLLRTRGGCDFPPEHLLNVFSDQRQRFLMILEGFGADDWAAPTRCADWSAQDVVRHLCDGNQKAAAIAPDDRTLDTAAGFDPRVTPRGWLAASAGESPQATLSRFVATTEQRFAGDRVRLAQALSFDVQLPYGPMDWTVRMLHGFWDSWLHERDVLLPRGIQHPTDDTATAYAAAYGLFIAAAVASLRALRVHHRLTLGGGVFDLDATDGVTLTVTPMTTPGPPPAEVTDALAGRAPVATLLTDLPADCLAALSGIGNFFNTPVEPSPP